MSQDTFENKIDKAMEQIISDTGSAGSGVGRAPGTSYAGPDISYEPPVRKHMAARIIGGVLGAVVLAGIGAYMGISYYYSNKFFPGTEINSIDCSNLTIAQTEELIKAKVEDYSLVIKSRGFDAVEVSAADIGYEYAPDGAVEQTLEDQNPITWVKGYFISSEHTAGENVTFSKKKVKKMLESLECMQSENQVEPQDAYITFQDTLFAIVPGAEGSAIDEDKALELIYAAISNTETEVDLDAGGAYKEPAVREDDESLIERLKIVNTYAKASVTHTFGDETETLDGTTIKDWYSTDANGDLYLDGEVLKSKLSEYVADMASRRNTLGSTRTFQATSGRTVEVSGGNYGWQIDQTSEVNQMYEEILTGQQVQREPVYSSTGLASPPDDIGDTYIEVDITEQHMYFYKSGKVILESDFVSGSMAKDDRKTPAGVCHLTYKTKDFTLRGEKKEDGTYEYEEPVSYWMPFNGGVGFHDAPWRSEFGGDIYKTSGSHGCINMPEDKAEELYDLIDESIPIIVFY